MDTAELVHEKTKALPPAAQREVLDFVEYLEIKLRKEDAEWSLTSIALALKGMEDESWPEFGDEDFRERWR